MKKLFLILIILGLIFFGWYYWRSIHAQTLDEDEMKARVGFKEVVVTEEVTNRVEGKYLSFTVKLPRYTQNDLMQAGGNVLEVEKFYGGIPKVTVTAIVEKLEGVTVFRDIPAVLMRINDQRMYSSSAGEKDGYEVMLFQSDSEKSAFWFGDGKSYSLVATGSDKERVNEVFDEVFSGLEVIAE